MAKGLTNPPGGKRIREVAIDNFLGFRSKIEVRDISNSSNIVIGRNNSGKTNFLRAIDFVLNPCAANRQNLTNIQNSAHRNLPSSVKISMDLNGFNVTLKRVLTGSDGYYINGKKILRKQFLTILKFIGYYGTNPSSHFIRYQSFSMIQKQVDRSLLQYVLNLVQPAILDMFPSLNQLHNFINDLCLTVLEHLSEMEKLDSSQSSLETDAADMVKLKILINEQAAHKLSLYSKILTEKQDKKMKIIDQLRVLKSKDEGRQLGGISSLQLSHSQKLEDLQSKIKSLVEEKEKLLAEFDKKHYKLERIKLNLKNATENASDKELKKFEEVISKYDGEIKEISECQKFIKNERSQDKGRLNAAITKRNLLLKEMSIRESAQADEGYEEFIRSQLSDTNAQLNQIYRLKERAVLDKTTLEDNICMLQQKVQKCSDASVDLSLAEKKKNIARDHISLKEQLRCLQEQESKTKSKLEELSILLRKAKSAFGRKVGWGVAEGCFSISKVVNCLAPEKKSKYHGMVTDLLEINKNITLALETALGKRLFFHIVDTSNVSSEIMKMVNEQKLPGEIWFAITEVIENPIRKHPPSEDALCLLDLVKFPPEVTRVMNFLLGNIFVCPNLEVASQVSRSYSVTCVTVLGEKVSANGVMSGGYYNRSQLSFELWKSVKDTDLKFQKCQNELNVISSEISQKQCILGLKFFELSNIKMNKTAMTEKMESIEIIIKEIAIEKESLEQLCNLIDTYDTRILSCVENIQTLTNILNQDFDTQEDIPLQLETYNKLVFQLQQKINKSNLSEACLIEKKKACSQIITKLTRMVYYQKLWLASQKVSYDKCQTIKLSIQETESKLQAINFEIDYLLSELNTAKEEVSSSSFQVVESGTTETISSSEQEDMDIDSLRVKLKSVNNLINYFEEKYAQLINANIPLNEDLLTLSCSKLRSKIGDYASQISILKKELDGRNMKAASHLRKKEDLTRIFKKLSNRCNSLKNVIAGIHRRVCQVLPKEIINNARANFQKYFKAFFPLGDAQLVYLPPSSPHQVSDRDIDIMGHCEIQASIHGLMENLSTLSGGQKKVAYISLIFAAASISSNINYILLDDIECSLDKQFCQTLARVLKECSKNVQIIASSHDNIILSAADKIMEFRMLNDITQLVSLSPSDAAQRITSSQFVLSSCSASE